MKMRLYGLLSSMAAAALVVACGSTGDESVFNDPNKQPGDPNGGPNGQFIDHGPHPTSSACVSSLAGAELTPVNLVFMYDKSGSMGNPQENASFDPQKRWIPVGTALKSFLGDKTSQGMNASLAFFPLDGDINVACGGDYQTPRVGLTPLTNPAPLIAAIDATTPAGGTPTLPALQGAIKYAQSIAAKRPNEKTSVVLVTDGYPGLMVNGSFGPGCADNDIAHVAAAAQAAFQGSPSISTYVIGVDSALTNLNSIAAAGGTGQAFMVTVGDPSATKDAFRKALDSIRQVTMSCDFALPPPPNGQKIDTNAVNVVVKDAAGNESVVGYSADCSTGVGWHYDDRGNPQRVQLCASTCQQLQADRTAKINLAFGCLTDQITR
jgi:hypothetical protein